VAQALGEKEETLLRFAGHLPAAPPETDLDRLIMDVFAQLSDARRQTIAALMFDLAGKDASRISAGAGQRQPTEEDTRDAEAVWEDVVIEMEYCGQLFADGLTDRERGERHFLSLQQTLLRLFWILSDSSDQAWAANFTRRMLNAYRRYERQHGGEGHQTPARTDTTNEIG